MPKGIYSRAKYDVNEEVEKVLSQQPTDKLKDKEFCWALVKRAVPKANKMRVGRVRNRLLEANSGHSNNGHTPVDPNRTLDLVLKLESQLGGLDALERAIATIRKVRGKA